MCTATHICNTTNYKMDFSSFLVTVIGEQKSSKSTTISKSFFMSPTSLGKKKNHIFIAVA